MRIGTIILTLAILASIASSAATNDCKFYRRISTDDVSFSSKGSFFVYTDDDNTYVVDRKTGIPIMRPVKKTDMGMFYENDSVFLNEKIKNKVFNLYKYDMTGNLINNYILPDTFAAGNTFYMSALSQRPYSVYYSKNKYNLVRYDLENQKQLAAFTFPTQEVWDEVQNISYSLPANLLVVTYPYFYIFYDNTTGDSLSAVFRDGNTFAGFSKDGNYYFMKDTAGISVFNSADRSFYYKWKDPIFRLTGFSELKYGHKLLLTCGDTLSYLDTNQLFVHRNNIDFGFFQPTYIGDTLYFYYDDGTEIKYYDYSFNYLYKLNSNGYVPLAYSDDEKKLLNIDRVGTKPLSITNPENNYDIQNACYMYSLKSCYALASENLITGDLKYYYDASFGNKKINKHTIDPDSIVDTINTQTKPYLAVGNSNATYMLVQDTTSETQLVNLASKETYTPFDCPAGIVQLSPDGNTCLAVKNYLIDWQNSYSGYLLYDTHTGRKIMEANGFNYSIIGYGSAAFSPDSRAIAIADSTDSLSIFSTSDGSLLRKIKMQWPMPTALRYTPDAKHIVYSSTEGQIGAIDMESGSTRFVYNELYGEPITQILISPHGKYLAATTRRKTVAEWAPDWNFTPAEGDGSVPPMNSIVAVPNPARSSVSITICGEEVGNGTVEVFSSLGERCYVAAFQKSTATAEISIDCTAFAKGAYFVRATVGGRTVAVGKFMVE